MDIEKLKEVGVLVTYPKNFVLVKKGNLPKKLWVLEKGIARYIYYQKR